MDNKAIFKKDWFEKGIIMIQNIVDFRTNTFYTFQEIQRIYNVVNNDRLFYNSLVYCIPLEWIPQLLYSQPDYTPQTYQIMRIRENTKINQLFYNMLVKEKKPKIIKQVTAWNNELNNENINWKLVFLTPITLTIETKLRAFQYKYLMNILPNNTYLLKISIASTAMCDFCCTLLETIEHMFWRCQYAQDLWNNVYSLISQNNETMTCISFENVSFTNVIINTQIRINK